MATKTISIELDVYNWLSSMKQTTKDSFSQVLRRTKTNNQKLATGASILSRMQDLKKENYLLSEEALNEIENAHLMKSMAKDSWEEN